MKPIFAIVEDASGNVTGALVGTDPEGLQMVQLDPSDVVPRSDLPIRASDLCRKYGLQPSAKMQEALSRALTPPVPDGA